MAVEEAYMFSRDPKESTRLDIQHDFMRNLSYGHLIHPSIPRQSLRAIADVGTGTGIWIQDVATELAQPIEYVGFDISSQQFLPRRLPGVDLVVHDATKPFPSQHYGKFDLVHVRLLSFAVRAADVQKLVHNVVQILRPGGFLEWQECDAIDNWATPATPKARAKISYIVAERIARGLTPAIVPPLLEALQSQVLSPADGVSRGGMRSALSWNQALLRITRLETVSTHEHPSTKVRENKHRWIVPAAIQFLRMGASRKRRMLGERSDTDEEAARIMEDINAMEMLVRDMEDGKDPADAEWESDLTWIVARKAILVDDDEDWMSAVHSVTGI